MGSVNLMLKSQIKVRKRQTIETFMNEEALLRVKKAFKVTS